jgi:IS30 family transposase
MNSLTWDRGTELATKGHDLSGYTQRHLDTIAAKLNTRPRKTLGYATPAATIAENVAPTP